MDRDLNFFKVITPRVGDERRLQLPPGCRERMEDFPNNVTLKDQYNYTWQVEISKYGRDWYFTKGWMECYNAIRLEVGDIVLFDYKGNDVFGIKIIGSNECDKERVVGPSFIVKDEELELDGDEERENLPDIKQEDNSYEMDSSDDEGAEEQRKKDVGIKQEVEEADNTFEMDSSDESDDESAEDETDDSNEDFDQVKEESEEEEVYMPKEVSKSKAKRKACDQPGSSATHFGVGTVPQRRKYRRGSGSNCYGSDIFKSGLISRPKNPYFVTKSRPTNRGKELYIPSDVIKDFKLNIPVTFHLVDKEGRKWGTKIKQWGDGRVWCVRGWDSLCEWNDIEKDDVCICEFLQGEGEENFCIKVEKVEDPRN